MHSSLVVTTEGLPLGLAAVQFWTRKEFKGANELKRHINPTRVPIEEKESIRWLSRLVQSSALLGGQERCVHVGDRENDIYEFFCAAREAGTHFLVRTCVDRLASDGRRTVAARDGPRSRCRRAPHRGHGGGRQCHPGRAQAAIQAGAHPAADRQTKALPALDLTVLHAREARKPRGRERIEWKLVADLAIDSPEDAVEKLQWYAQRWKIELFHKILKSGCHVEAARLRTAERLTKLIAVFCILSWRIFWTTMVNRIAPDAPHQSALTEVEMSVIDRAVRDRPTIPTEKTLSHYLMKIACLGGYLARARDRPPGTTVMWRGWSRLMDIVLGAELMQPKCG